MMLPFFLISTTSSERVKVLAGEHPVIERCARSPNVEVAGGARSKSYAYGHIISLLLSKITRTHIRDPKYTEDPWFHQTIRIAENKNPGRSPIDQRPPVCQDIGREAHE